MARTSTARARAQHDCPDSECRQRSNGPWLSAPGTGCRKASPRAAKPSAGSGGGRGEAATRYTRSLDFSAIKPVGRQVMMTIITASANTSL